MSFLIRFFLILLFIVFSNNIDSAEAVVSFIFIITFFLVLNWVDMFLTTSFTVDLFKFSSQFSYCLNLEKSLYMYCINFHTKILKNLEKFLNFCIPFFLFKFLFKQNSYGKISFYSVLFKNLKSKSPLRPVIRFKYSNTFKIFMQSYILSISVLNQNTRKRLYTYVLRKIA